MAGKKRAMASSPIKENRWRTGSNRVPLGERDPNIQKAPEYVLKAPEVTGRSTRAMKAAAEAQEAETHSSESVSGYTETTTAQSGETQVGDRWKLGVGRIDAEGNPTVEESTEADVFLDACDTDMQEGDSVAQDNLSASA